MRRRMSTLHPIVRHWITITGGEATYHRHFSSSVSAKNVISWSWRNTTRNDFSMPYGISSSSTCRLRLLTPDSGLRAPFAAPLSSTATALRRSIVAVTFFVTSLYATRLAPTNRRCLRRHDCSRQGQPGEFTQQHEYARSSHPHTASMFPRSMSSCAS